MVPASEVHPTAFASSIDGTHRHHRLMLAAVLVLVTALVLATAIVLVTVLVLVTALVLETVCDIPPTSFASSSPGTPCTDFLPRHHRLILTAAVLVLVAVLEFGFVLVAVLEIVLEVVLVVVLVLVAVLEMGEALRAQIELFPQISPRQKASFLAVVLPPTEKKLSSSNASKYMQYGILCIQI